MTDQQCSLFSLLLLLIFSVPISITAQTSSTDLNINALGKLRDRMIELKKISADKQQQIDRLERTVLSLSSKSERLQDENFEVRTTIRTKTEEIFKLRSELNNILSEYDQLLLNLNQVESEKKKLEKVISELNSDRATLIGVLEEAKGTIQSLTDSLSKVNLENEANQAEIDNLERSLNEILNNVVFISFVELSLNLFNGARFGYQGGWLLKKSNLFIGGKAGYQFLRNRESQSRPAELGLLPISIQLAAVFKNRIGFEYVGINEQIIDNRKVFIFADAGWSLPLHAADDNFYGNGGLNASFGGGVILNLNEGVNTYAKGSLNIQNVSSKTNSSTRTFFFTALTFGLMF